MELTSKFLSSEFLILFSISILYGVLGFSMLFILRKSVLGLRYFVLGFSVMIWASFISLSFVFSATAPEAGVILLQIAYFAAIFIGAMIYLLTANIPTKENIIPRNIHAGVWGATAVLAILYILAPEKFFVFSFLSGGEPTFSGGPWFWLYGAFFIILSTGGGIKIFNTYRKSAGRERGVLAVGFYGIILTIVGAVSINIFLPVFGIQKAVFWFGHIFPLMGMLSVAYMLFEITGRKGRVFLGTFLSIVLLLGLGFEVLAVENLERVIPAAVTLAMGIFIVLILYRDFKVESVDLQQLRELLERVQQSNKELRRADRAKTEFLAIASHHLRTPLTLVKWVLSGFLKGEYGIITADQREVLSKLEKRNERLVRLVNSLLDVSRFEHGISLKKETVFPGAMINTFVDEFIPHAEDRQVTCVVDESVTNLPPVEADKNLLSRVFEGLLENAILYNKKGGEVRIFGEVSPPFIRISIQDTGIGMDSEDLERAGEKFFRAEKARKLAAEGTGVGLYLAREILRLHGGSLDVTSTEGEGTTVTVMIPYEKQAISVATRVNGKIKRKTRTVNATIRTV